MVLDHKSIQINERTFAEYIRVKGPYYWQTTLRDRACFIYWMNGENRMYWKKGEIHSRGKESLLLNCGAYIDEVFSKDNEEIEAVIVHFYPDWLKGVFEHHLPPGMLDEGRVSTLLPTKIQPHELLANYIEGLLWYIQHPGLTNQELLFLKLKELFLLLERTHLRLTVKDLFKGLFCREEVLFKEVIASNLFSGLGSSELAYLTHRSLASFKRDFRKYYGSTPSRYIRNAKLERAANLLAATHMRIGDIIHECGFNNASHFSRLFHQKFHKSPTAYRLSHMIE